MILAAGEIITQTVVLLAAITGIAVQIGRYHHGVQSDNYHALEVKVERLERDLRDRDTRITQMTEDLSKERSRPNLDGVNDLLNQILAELHTIAHGGTV